MDPRDPLRFARGVKPVGRETVTAPPEVTKPRTFLQKYGRYLYPVIGTIAGLTLLGGTLAVNAYGNRSRQPPNEPSRVEQIAPEQNPIVIPPIINLETPTPTPEPISLAKIAPLPVDPLVQLINSNPDLNYQLTDRTRQAMIRELRDSPYFVQLLSLIDQLSEAWNYKVRREDEVLCIIIPQNQPGFDCNSEGVWQFRFDNGGYHLQLWLDGNAVYPLDKENMEKWFPKKEDREFEYINRLWLPKALGVVNLKTWVVQPQQELDFSIMKDNMDVILGRAKINNLPYRDLRERIIVPYNDKTLQSYVGRERELRLGKKSDYERSQELWQIRQNQTLPEIHQVGELWRNDYDPVLAQNWKDYDLLRTAYGLAVIDMKLPESFDVRVASILVKALGGGMGEVLGRYTASWDGKPYVHQVVSIQPPFAVVEKLPSTRIVERGQTVFSYGDKRLDIKYFILD